MKVQQVKDYNRDEMVRYSKVCDEWKRKDSNSIIPQQAFFGFYTNAGNFRETGYVATEENIAIWRKTKKQAIKDLRIKCLELRIDGPTGYTDEG